MGRFVEIWSGRVRYGRTGKTAEWEDVFCHSSKRIGLEFRLYTKSRLLVLEELNKYTLKLVLLVYSELVLQALDYIF